MEQAKPRIGVLVVAYNAQSTLASVLDRIPSAFRDQITAVLVSDDHSTDQTFEVGVRYLSDSELPLEIVARSRNLGYGGNQKAGYHWAIENGLDIVVMLHGDGQYAPEHLPEMVAPIVAGDADAVFGSRMLDAGAARKGGMPAYKFIGNKTLTAIQNALAGASLSEWHSGYRAYSVSALRDIPFERNDQGFRFDTQIILQLLEANKRIVEVPIPTFYGDEICYVNGVSYAREIIVDVVRYRAHRVGLGSGDLAFTSSFVPRVTEPERAVAERHQSHPDAVLLDLSDGYTELGSLFEQRGDRVVTLDELLGPTNTTTPSGVDPRLDDHIAEFEVASSVEQATFDAILAMDVLARVRDPERLLRSLHRMLRPNGVLYVSVANIGHWYPRFRLGAGLFDYDQRGSLDKRHMRLFSARAVRRLTVRTGWTITASDGFGLPFDAASDRSPKTGRIRTAPSWIRWLDRRLAKRWPSLFAYSLLYELRPAAPRRASRASSSDPMPTEVDLGTPAKFTSPLG